LLVERALTSEPSRITPKPAVGDSGSFCCDLVKNASDDDQRQEQIPAIEDARYTFTVRDPNIV
jgi:hypothetical protein